MPNEIAAKHEALEEVLASLGSVLVCYSGGLDSTVLLTVAAHRLKSGCNAMTAVGPWVDAAETEEARRYATELGVVHRVVSAGQMEDEAFVNNTTERCYHCKRRIFEVAQRLRDELGAIHIIDGTNVDDLRDYRPGRRAAKEAGVRGPFVEVGMGKGDVRELARVLGLSGWDRPAFSCYATRLPLGMRISEERLRQVAAFEGELRARGWRVVRVRHHGDVARIELGESEMEGLMGFGAEERARLVEVGRKLGFRYVAVDLAGYRMGSMNAASDGEFGGT